MKTTLAGRLFNVPLLVESAYLETVCRFTQARIKGESIDLDYKGRSPTNSLNYFSMIDGQQSLVEESSKEADSQIAVIPVMGSLMHRANGLDAISSSGRGYNTIKNDINSSLRDESIGGVALHVATNGGEVSGNFDLSRWINEIQSQTDKPVWALVDESAYSAGYSIASSAGRIHTTRSGGVGSIGVVVAHANYEKMMKKEGVQVTYVHAGKHKVDGNPYQALEGSALASVQKDIEYHYSHFVELVANNRGISEQSVRDTEAKTFNSDDALELGLVDAVMSTDDSLQEMFEHINKPNNSKTHLNKQGSKSTASNPQDGPAVETTKGNEMTEQVTVSEADIEKAVNENNEKWSALMAHDKGGNSKAVAEIMSFGMSLENSLKAMDLVAVPEASKETAEVEVDPTGEAEATRTTLAEIKNMFEATMKGGDVNSVNTNSASDSDKEAAKPAFDAKAEHARLTGAA